MIYRIIASNLPGQRKLYRWGEAKLVANLVQTLPNEHPWITHILGPEHPRAYAAGARKFIERKYFRTFPHHPDSLLEGWDAIGMGWGAHPDPCLANFIKFGA